VAALDSLGIDILASIVFAVLGFAAGRVYESIHKRRKLGHVYALLSSGRRITVVFPPETTVPTEGQPVNAVRMSLAEGAAIARIGQICRDARSGTEMYLIHPDDHHPNRGPFVMIGDPAKSEWSSQWIAKNFHELKFDPEKRRLDYDSTRWETRIVDGVAKQDFGFIMVGRTDAHVPFLLLWGASEFGTNIAARAYGDLHHQLSRERYNRVVAGETWLFIARADVDKYGVRTDDVNHVSIVANYPAHHWIRHNLDTLESVHAFSGSLVAGFEASARV
jgi:hypothetical protein